MWFFVFVSQSETSGQGDTFSEETDGKRPEHEIGAQGTGPARTSGRMRGARAPDNVPGPAGAGGVHGQVPDPAAIGSLSPGVGKAVHDGGHVQPPDHGRPQPEHVDFGQPRARAGHQQCRVRVRLPTCRRRRRVAVTVVDGRAIFVLND